MAFIKFLRLIADGQIKAEEAVCAYHSVLEKKNIRPHRPLDEDLTITNQAMSYDSTNVSKSKITVLKEPGYKKQAMIGDNDSNHNWPKKTNGLPDFGKMTKDQRLAYYTNRLNN